LGVIEQQTVTDRRTHRETIRQRGCFTCTYYYSR